MMLETLYIARHAPAEDDNPSRPGDDSQRRLLPEGVVEARQMFAAMQARGMGVDCIWTSPYVRTQQTAQIAAEFLEAPGGIKARIELAPSGNLDSLLPEIGRARARAMLVVGHAPGVGVLVSKLCADGRLRVVFERTGVAALSIGGLPERLRAELLWMVPPYVLIG